MSELLCINVLFNSGKVQCDDVRTYGKTTQILVMLFTNQSFMAVAKYRMHEKSNNRIKRVINLKIIINNSKKLLEIRNTLILTV